MQYLSFCEWFLSFVITVFKVHPFIAYVNGNPFFKKNFWMWTVFNCLYWVCQVLLLFMFWIFGCKACGILAPQPGIIPTSFVLEGKVLTTGPPGKSQWYSFLELINIPLFVCTILCLCGIHLLMDIWWILPFGYFE